MPDLNALPTSAYTRPLVPFMQTIHDRPADRDPARLHARLPLLPGRDDHPAHAAARSEAGPAARRDRAQGVRLRGGGAPLALLRRLRAPERAPRRLPRPLGGREDRDEPAVPPHRDDERLAREEDRAHPQDRLHARAGGRDRADARGHQQGQPRGGPAPRGRVGVPERLVAPQALLHDRAPGGAGRGRGRHRRAREAVPRDRARALPKGRGVRGDPPRGLDVRAEAVHALPVGADDLPGGDPAAPGARHRRARRAATARSSSSRTTRASRRSRARSRSATGASRPPCSPRTAAGSGSTAGRSGSTRGAGSRRSTRASASTASGSTGTRTGAAGSTRSCPGTDRLRRHEALPREAARGRPEPRRGGGLRPRPVQRLRRVRLRGRQEPDLRREGLRPGAGAAAAAAAPPIRSRVRVRWAKLGRLVALSHLETMHTLLRAIRRARAAGRVLAGLPPEAARLLRPGPAGGIESLAEFMDLELVGSAEAADVATRLARELPDGLEVLDARRSIRADPSIAESLRAAHYRVEFQGDGWDEATLSRTNRGVPRRGPGGRHAGAPPPRAAGGADRRSRRRREER